MRPFYLNNFNDFNQYMNAITNIFKQCKYDDNISSFPSIVLSHVCLYKLYKDKKFNELAYLIGSIEKTSEFYHFNIPDNIHTKIDIYKNNFL